MLLTTTMKLNEPGDGSLTDKSSEYRPFRAGSDGGSKRTERDTTHTRTHDKCVREQDKTSLAIRDQKMQKWESKSSSLTFVKRQHRNRYVPERTEFTIAVAFTYGLATTDNRRPPCISS